MHHIVRFLLTLACAAAVATGTARAQSYGLVNLAKNRPVAAATPVYLGGPPSVATDGKASTYWYSGFLQEYTVDLGVEVPIGLVLVYASQAGSIELLSSVDGTAFQLRHSVNFADAVHANWPGAGVSGPMWFQADGTYTARYFRYRSIVAPSCGCYQGTLDFAVYEWTAAPRPVLTGENFVLRPGVTVRDLLRSDPAYPVANLADGRADTSWVGAHWGAMTPVAGRQFFITVGQAEIDLGADLPVHGVRVRRPAAGGAQAIAVSLFNGARAEVDWYGHAEKDVLGTSTPVAGDVEWVLEAPVYARYLRIQSSQPQIPALNSWPAVAEVEVFGEIVTPGDTTPPIIQDVPPPITVTAERGAFGSVVSWPLPTAIDDVDGALPVTCSPQSGSWFPIGTTTVRCKAADHAGNESNVPLNVTVIAAPSDTAPPTIVPTGPTVATLWPANGKPARAAFRGVITDNESAAQAISVSFSVTDEYGAPQPSGTLALGADGSFELMVSLEARRNGADRDGRLYRITVTAGDASGNATVFTFSAVVPHDQRR